VKRSFKFLLRPTQRQEGLLAAMLEDHRKLYNAALEERREAWRMRRESVSYYMQAVQLPAIRRADQGGQERWSAGSQQQTLRRLDKTFAAFFRRTKARKERPGYPRFRGRGWFDTVDWPAQKNGVRWDSVPHPSVTRVYLLGIGHVRVHQHRSVKGRIKTISVKREAARWFVVLSCDDVPSEPLPATGAAVGIDLGVASFATTSSGEHVPNPRHLAASAGRVAAAQQALARKKRGSSRRKKAVAKVANLHGKVRRQRLDHAYKTALALVRDNDVIVHEALRVTSMTRRPKPRPAESGCYEPNGAAAKARLNKAILDAGWGVFLNVLRAKAESAGRVVVEVDPRHTSQACSECRHIAAGNRVSRAVFRCLACGHKANADVNAAKNILRAGLALQAACAA
jgi:putative transposase